MCVVRETYIRQDTVPLVEKPLSLRICHVGWHRISYREGNTDQAGGLVCLLGRITLYFGFLPDLWLCDLKNSFEDMGRGSW